MSQILKALQAWLQKAEQGSSDVIYDYEGRKKKHDELLEKYGFPSEEEILEAREKGQPKWEKKDIVLGEPTEPPVNEAGE